MNDRSLPRLLLAVDTVLASAGEPNEVAARILQQVEARAPGSVLRQAASLQLRSLGCPSRTGR